MLPVRVFHQWKWCESENGSETGHLTYIPCVSESSEEPKTISATLKVSGDKPFITHTHATWQFQHYMLCASDLESLKQKLDLTDLIDYWMVYIKTDWWMTADEMPFLVLECEDLSMKLYTVCVWLCRLLCRVAQIQYFETNTSEILQLLVPILQKECYWTHTQKKY